MARCILVVDSETGALIDVAGNVREGARYKKFVGRMLSLAKNPVLDYGTNGGNELEISRAGRNGSVIRLKADKVIISGDLQVNGSSGGTGGEISTGDLAEKIVGTDGEIVISEVTDSEDEENTVLKVSLSDSVKSTLRAAEEMTEDADQFVTKDDLASAIQDLSVSGDDTLDDVKETLGILLTRLQDLVDSGGTT